MTHTADNTDRQENAVSTMTARRNCSWIECPNGYDAIAGTNGTTWRRWNTLGLLLCPDHGHVWVPQGTDAVAAHGPSLNTTSQPPVMWCTCGWRHDTAGLNAGQVAQAYLLHLHGGTTTSSEATQLHQPDTCPDGPACPFHRLRHVHPIDSRELGGTTTSSEEQT